MESLRCCQCPEERAIVSDTQKAGDCAERKMKGQSSQTGAGQWLYTGVVPAFLFVATERRSKKMSEACSHLDGRALTSQCQAGANCKQAAYGRFSPSSASTTGMPLPA